MTKPAAPRIRRFQRGNLLTNVVLVLPILIFYEIGVLFTDVMNGADLLTQNLIRWVGLGGFLWFQGGLVLVLIALMAILRRRQRFEIRHFFPVVLESSIYAALMGTFIIFVMTQLMHIDPRLATQADPAAAATVALAQRGVFDRLVMSAGAGIHEELLFRLCLMQGLIVVFSKLVFNARWAAIFWAILLSSLIFSAAHHLGPLGDPLRLGVFVYRTLAGVIFALLYYFRSFAIAVYTHTLYDIYVLLAA